MNANNIQRHLRETARPRQFAVDSAVVIAIGDLCYMEVDDVRPASSLTYTNGLAQVRSELAGKFIGVAAQESANAQTKNIRVDARGIFLLPCTSGTFEVGDFVGAAEISGAASLDPRTVDKVYSPFEAIGRVVKRESSAVTVVEVEIFSRYLNPGLDMVYNPATDVRFFEDFLGAVQTARWGTVDVGAATEAPVSTHGGAFRLALTSASEAQDAVLYMSDVLNFDIDLIKRIRFKATVVVAPGTGVVLVMGMGSAHNLDKDTMAEFAWFRLQADLNLLIESDDGTNNNDDKDTLVNLVAGEAHIFEIDFSDTSAITFYVDGAAVIDAAPTTFDMSNYAGLLQPYFSLDKPSDTSLGTLDVDWVEIICKRA